MVFSFMCSTAWINGVSMIIFPRVQESSIRNIKLEDKHVVISFIRLDITSPLRVQNPPVSPSSLFPTLSLLYSLPIFLYPEDSFPHTLRHQNWWSGPDYLDSDLQDIPAMCHLSFLRLLNSDCLNHWLLFFLMLEGRLSRYF